MQGYTLQANLAGQLVFFLMVSSSDHITGVAGLVASLSITLFNNNATPITPAGARFDVGHGIYCFATNAGDVQYNGPLWLHVEAAGCDPTDMCFLVVAYDYTNRINLGLTALPVADPWATMLPGAYATGMAGSILGKMQDPWNMPLPGAYPAGSAGAILYGNLDAKVSTRSTYAGGDTAGTTTLLGLLTPTRAGNLDNLAAGGVGLTALAPASTALSTAVWTTARASNLDALAAGGVGLTALAQASTALSTAVWTGARAANLDRLDATVSSRSTYTGGDTPGTTSILATLAGWAVPGDPKQFTAHALALAPGGGGGGADPWVTPLPGAYVAGTAGYLLGTNLDAAVSSRSTYAGGPVASVTAPVAVAGGTVTTVTNPVAVASGTVTTVTSPVVVSAGTVDTVTTITNPVSVASGTVTAVANPVTVGTVQDKGGYSLAATGLDAIPIAAPAGVAATFREMLVQVWRRLFRYSIKSVQTGQMQTFADDGVTVLTTQAWTDDGTGNETLGAAQ